MNYKLYVGMDIAARSASLAMGKTEESIEAAGSIRQTPAGWQKMIEQLQATGYRPEEILVVIEATGSYWMRPAKVLHEAGYAVSVINPKQAYHYAQAVLQQAKTDEIDARLLSRLGMSLRPAAWQPPSDIWEELYQRLVERDGIVEMRQMARNQRHARQQRSYQVEQVEERQAELLDHLDLMIAEIDREVEAILQLDKHWQEAAERLRSIPGIGLLSTAWLLVVTDCFTACDQAKQLVSYLGLAPHPVKSGTSRRGHRAIGGGHARARRVLYQAAVSAAQYNPAIKAFYERLVARGKHVKVARCAATRKLVCIAFAIVTKEQMFDPYYHLSKQQIIVT